MKLRTWKSAATGLAICLCAWAGAATATPTVWTQTIDPDDEYMSAGSIYVLDFDLSWFGFNVGSHRISSFVLSMAFADEDIICTGNCGESASVDLPGADYDVAAFNLSSGYGVVTSKQWTHTVPATYEFADSGLLRVTVRRATGDFYFSSATLKATGDLIPASDPPSSPGSNPVPEPGTLSLLAVAGLSLVATHRRQLPRGGLRKSTPATR